jgi:hypothetical protein
MPVNPIILKDLFNQSSKLHKNPYFGNVYKLVTNSGLGLSFAEGADWKRRRRIISSVFNFDFLNEVIPLI